ncbi:ROK family protein [Cellulomonas sp. 179-A 4D5 NHS]|uniref:ROK family protein n=1 Tax=Cellulomonas sp. 179-A 4D5 NHS TaxID=3142378 RepID=UPI00399FD468
MSVISGSPQQLRRANLAAVLDFAWDAGPFTATDAIDATGLTRTTVLGLCDDLVGLGWLRELSPERLPGDRAKGRPARRYAFDRRAGHVVGVDAGQHRVTASVADLAGTVLARSTRVLEPTGEAPRARLDGARLDGVRGAVDDALDEAGAHAGSVLVTVVGVPAPTDELGRPPASPDGFWARMNPGIVGALDRPGHRVVVDNDANLAAIAEGAVGAGVGTRSFVTLLSGERFGAGLMVDGVLLRGRHGGAGELHVLDLVDGVGSASGLAATVRQWLTEERGLARLRGRLPAEPEFADVAAAALAGDRDAQRVVDRLGDRLARVCAVLGGLLDVERVIVGGAVAASAGPVLERTTASLAAYMHLPVPEVVASTLGADGVHLGAVRSALALVRADPLAVTLPAGRGDGPSEPERPAPERHAPERLAGQVTGADAPARSREGSPATAPG